LKKGAFITIYGINNVGKSTHARLLVERLKKEGYKAHYVKYPVYDVSPSGPFINKILRGSDKQHISEEELQMWFVINRYQFQPKLQKLLEDGNIVVAEDYRGTGIAWGISKGLDENWVETINSKVLPEDFVIFLDGTRELRAKEKRHVHEQNDDLSEKCGEVHHYLAKKYGWKRVKVQSKINDTAELVWEVTNEFLKKR
jgi:dTMP kinase